MSSPHPAARHVLAMAPMRLALLTADGAAAGSPAAEIGRRLERMGHEVVTLPSDRPETRSRRHGIGGQGPLSLAAPPGRDVVLVFDPARAGVVPLLRRGGAAVALHLDDMPLRPQEGTRRTRIATRLAVREADVLVSSTRAIADRAAEAFHVAVEHVPDGTRIVRRPPTDALDRLGLLPGGFHLLMAPADTRLRVDVVLAGYRRSAARLPLVVIPARDADGDLDLRVRDPRIRMLGPVRDERVLDQLFAHAAASLHAGPRGGADASVLRAMGAGTAIVAPDAPVNRELAGTAGSYFRDAEDLALVVEEVERYPFRFADIGELMRDRARRRHDWDAAAEAVEAIAVRLTRGRGTRTRPTDRVRRPASVIRGARIASP